MPKGLISNNNIAICSLSINCLSTVYRLSVGCLSAVYRLWNKIPKPIEVLVKVLGISIGFTAVLQRFYSGFTAVF